MKKSMNTTINNARNLLNTLSNITPDELELALALVNPIPYGVRLDKLLADMEDMEEEFESSCTYTFMPKMGWTKRASRRGHVLKDKAKHGYHLPRRWEYREYNRGEIEELKMEAVIKANKAQLNEEAHKEVSIDEGVAYLRKLYKKEFREEYDRLAQYGSCRSYEWYTLDRIEEVKEECHNFWLNIQSRMGEFYEKVDLAYPEEGLEWRNEVIRYFVDNIQKTVQFAFDSAVGYIRFCIKGRIRNEMEKLEDEMRKVNHLRVELKF